ncbi:hypothetical protein BS47DRAFT_1369793 [Hydnum rufescens UP504]|uniref:Uncharacterized protein n=1 Tax=Hydnum rufescens UP504 TaxID=1448309 RepID=A0A9P6ADF0_9AGAM|nr:hypothetical protein BS47DRAFT_1369793 [Hydnum rufescens UP504]
MAKGSKTGAWGMLLKAGPGGTLLKAGPGGTLLKAGPGGTLLKAGLGGTLLKAGLGGTLLKAGPRGTSLKTSTGGMLSKAHARGTFLPPLAFINADTCGTATVLISVGMGGLTAASATVMTEDSILGVNMVVAATFACFLLLLFSGLPRIGHLVFLMVTTEGF